MMPPRKRVSAAHYFVAGAVLWLVAIAVIWVHLRTLDRQALTFAGALIGFGGILMDRDLGLELLKLLLAKVPALRIGRSADPPPPDGAP